MGIRIGAHAAGGFVECNVNLALDGDRLTAHGYGIARGINLGAEDATRLAIDRNLASFDELLAATPRGYARFRQILLQTDEHGGVADYSGLVFGRPETRSPSFQRPCFLSTLTRSNRLRTLRRAWILLAPLRL